MNAIQFIKENGVEKAREVVDGAPENSICYDLEHGKHVAYEDTSIAMCFLKNRFIDLSDLKRLVESVDLVKSYGGIINAKNELILLQKHLNNTFGYVTIITSEKIENLEQAIADYEQLFGNTETSELETLRDCDTSPNCKKFDERVK